jgi:hypothetical protein
VQLERINDERDAAKRKLEFSKTVGAQVRFYKSNGVSDSQQARRLALNDLADEAAELGIAIPQLTAADNKRLELVSARIARTQGLAAGGGRGSVPLMAQLENGQLVPASLVNREAGAVMLGGQAIPVTRYLGGNISNQPQAQAQPQQAYPAPKGMGPAGIPLAPDYQPPPAAPKLTSQQKRRFEDIKRNQPGYSDEQILSYMRERGWLK